jgi:hypothetical protein
MSKKTKNIVDTEQSIYLYYLRNGVDDNGKDCRRVTLRYPACLYYLWSLAHLGAAGERSPFR